jgi:RND family efflux transporter MFP subunit
VIAIHDGFFPGGAFNRDDVLFEIEPQDYGFNVRRLEAEVARARTALDLETAESEAAVEEWRLLNGDTPVPDLVARRPQLAEARALLQSAEAQLEDAQLDLHRTRFTLPFSGRVLSSDIAIGQYVSAGQAYGSVFDSTSLEIRASLIDRQLEWLLQAPDPTITISARYLGEESRYHGVLNRAASSLEASTRFATVYFGFSVPVDDLLPGVFTHINIKGRELQGISVLPLSALQARNVVWQVTDDNILVRLEPEIIYQDEDHIAVRGLGETVEIVTSRVAGATEGMHVRVTNNPSPSPAAD